MDKAEEICDMIIGTISEFDNAQNIGIVVLDKFENNNEIMVKKLIEIAFHVQLLARGYKSQHSRAEECYRLNKV